LDNPNDSEDDCLADVESESEQADGIEESECQEQQDLRAAPNVPGMIRPTPKSTRQGETVLQTVDAMETSRNEGINRK